MPIPAKTLIKVNSIIATVLALQIAASGQCRADASDLFEKKIRPLFAAKCLSCHSGSGARAGLHLDSPTDLFRKMPSGKPTVVAGKPDKSAIYGAINGIGGIQMPPGGKLTPDEIGALTAWISQGATWPSGAKHITADLWSLKPVQHYSLPPVKDAAWPMAPFDRCLLAAIEGVGLKPSPMADKRTLCRRLFQDLTGLNPTAAQINDFIRDSRPDAYERLTDSLLASRAYGERWARHWMDIARYADSDEEGTLAQPEAAYAYRDWLIGSINADMPYNRFLTLQIAAGTEGVHAQLKDLPATGFLTLGRKFAGNPNDVVDDQLDVIMRGTQGLTIGCARCHDHKFDPMPMTDYYALAGVLSSCTATLEPLYDNKALPAQRDAFARELALRNEAVKNFIGAIQDKLRDRLVTDAAKYMRLAAQQDMKDTASIKGYDAAVGMRWRQALDAAKGDLDPVFTPWSGYAELKPSEFAMKSAALAKLYRQNSETRVRLNWQVAMMFAGTPPKSLGEVADRYQKLFTDVLAQWKRTCQAAKDAGAAEPRGLPVPAQEGIRQLFYGTGGPLSLDDANTEQAMNLEERSILAALRRRITALQNSAGAPMSALVLKDNPAPANAHILFRGDPARPGDEVPRRFVAVMNSVSPKTFTRGSGREELAAAIASPQNPLTARVFVNRVWMHLFGDAIVKTPGDFGSRGELPSNPALLDWLAADFVENGWSLKHLIKTIVSSSAYRMSSAPNAEGLRLDPENRLFWRQNRKRLDFEQLRDALLTAGGQIETCEGGKPFDLLARPYVRKRTIYAAIDRDNLPTLFRVFDFASPDASTAERFVTISPQQALFLLNSPFCMEQAVSAANAAGGDSLRSAVDAITNRLFGRPASAAEINAAAKYCRSPEPPIAPASERARQSVWSYGWGRRDSTQDRVVEFHALPTWTGENWTSGPVLPDPELGSMFLSKEGGAPGGDHEHQIIRRFTAPVECSVTIHGSIRHAGKMGDGIEARIVSSRTGSVGTWRVRMSEAKSDLTAISLKAGDTLDFVVDCIGNDLDDAFNWAPEIETADGSTKWSSAALFAGPQEQVNTLTRWQRFVQTLLLTNEFAFVD